MVALHGSSVWWYWIDQKRLRLCAQIPYKTPALIKIYDLSDCCEISTAVSDRICSSSSRYLSQVQREDLQVLRRTPSVSRRSFHVRVSECILCWYRPCLPKSSGDLHWSDEHWFQAALNLWIVESWWEFSRDRWIYLEVPSWFFTMNKTPRSVWQASEILENWLNRW